MEVVVHRNAALRRPQAASHVEVRKRRSRDGASSRFATLFSPIVRETVKNLQGR